MSRRAGEACVGSTSRRGRSDKRSLQGKKVVLLKNTVQRGERRVDYLSFLTTVLFILQALNEKTNYSNWSKMLFDSGGLDKCYFANLI